MAQASPPTQTVRALDRIGRRQLGLVTSAQLDGIAFGRGARQKALATGRLKRVRQGIYVLPGVTMTWEAALLAAVLAAGPDAVASHLSAARLWSLFDGQTPAGVDPRFQVTASGQRRLSGVRLHRARLENRDRSRHHSVPVTAPGRTIFDLATVLDADQLARCADEALRRRLVDLRELRHLFEDHAGPGRRRLWPLEVVLADRVPGFDPGANDWEQRMDRQWEQLGLPPGPRQYWVEVGGRRYCLDRAIPELRLAVEWVGKAYHSLQSRYVRDRMRISDLVQAGWDVVEVTPEWTPQRVYATVMAKVVERRRLLGDGASRAGDAARRPA
jgi:hypothetical protein